MLLDFLLGNLKTTTLLIATSCFLKKAGEKYSFLPLALQNINLIRAEA